MAKDYYGILNISKNATEDQIKKAYRKLAIKYHPDKNKSAAAEERFKEIAEAYELLTDRKKRHTYDQYNTDLRNDDDMSDCRNPKGGIFTYHFHGDPRATFAQFFGAANPFGAFYTTKKPSRRFESHTATKENDADIKSTPMRPSSPQSPPPQSPQPPPSQQSQPQHKFSARSNATPSTKSPTRPTTAQAPPPPKSKSHLKQDPPIEYDLFVTLEDIESGCTKKMRILRMVVEDDGQKRKEEKVLSISVKPGWKEGTKITFQKEGDRLPDMIPADIVFIIRDKPHPVFKRDGCDIRYNAVISLKRALCGTEIEVPTLQGDHILLNTHAEIIKPNTVKRITGRGLPYHREPNKRGDLLVDIVIKFPETLQTDAMEKLYDALPD